ncbi:LamG domain-containing protein [Massilia sp. IC2-477]|uniref:LamG domain-containing protein n=1 Tax=Massilia sp. IC2-477 TaxID=2887198 RepID=UPI001D12A7CC|nr:LamG domain-containing protein [Massilia sp. IC2-477]MCC2954213.1 LamG domain-containing protein [Massilia sp. IC2-477]
MSNILSIAAGLALVAVTGSAAALPIPVDHFIFNNNTLDTGSKPKSMAQAGSFSYASAPAGVTGKAAVFNSSGYLRSTSMAAISGDFSVSFWMKTGATSPQGVSQWYEGMGLVDAERGGVTTDWGLSFMNNKIGFGIGWPDTTITTATSVNDNQWHLVNASWQMNTGTMSLYLDGVLSNSKVVAASKDMTRANQNLLAIGGLATGINWFSGSIADVQVFDSVLSAAQVREIRSNAVPEPTSLALLGLAGLAGLVARRRRQA